MDSKMTICLESTKTDGDVTRVYQFLLPVNAPIGQVYDFCHEVLTEVTKMAQKAVDAAKPPLKEDKPAA